jgi:hypothetical protein
MFEALEDQIKTDDQKTTTKRERLVLWILIAVVSIILFGTLYFGIHLIEG